MLHSLAWIVAAAAVASAQTPAGFEVASVKPNLLNDRIVTIQVGPGGAFRARGYTLVLLIQRAYGVMDWNVTGGPPWIRDDRFDVAAKAAVNGNLTEAQLRPRLAKLLADRFMLRLHETIRPMPGYALEIAKRGVQFSPAVGPDDRDSFRMTQTDIDAPAVTMTDFARFVAGKLGVIAVDQTGLSGAFALHVHWTLPPDSPGIDPAEARRDAVFEAVDAHLGLKFTQKRVPVRTLVIDHAEKALASDN